LQKSHSPDTTKVQSLMETNSHVLQEVASLKSNIEHLHQQMNEREQIVSKHPDLSDNLIHDMQTQMRTNELHIDVLQKQNTSLKSSLEKLLLTSSNTNLSPVTEDLRSQPSHRYSYSNEIETPVNY
jgi:F0F1-type ATP synthase delta subunit